MSLNGTLLRFGQTLGPLFVGLAVELVGMNASFLISAGLALLMLLALLQAWPPESRAVRA